MSLKIFFLIAAEQELIETVQYYNSQCPGLGFEFAAEVTHTILYVSLNTLLHGTNYPREPTVVEPTVSLTVSSTK